MLKTSILSFDEKFSIRVNSFLTAQGNHLFNEPAYFKLHSHSDKDCYAQLVRRNDDRVYATIALHETAAGTYISPGRGTFGGLSLNGDLEFAAAGRFLQAVTDHLSQQGAQKIHIRCAPASHDGALFAITFNALMLQGFQPEEPEVNYDMQINARAFIDRINYGNVKRIRKAEREGFVCTRVDSSYLPAVHQLIANNRTRLGVLVSMSLEQLRQMVGLFPERLHMFAVYRDGSLQDMVAAAVCLALTPSVLYVLYWGDVDGMRGYSPIAMLAANIYSFGAERGFTLLDVGIASLHGEPNHGLVNFKRNLGCTESLKLEMVWSNKSGSRSIS